MIERVHRTLKVALRCQSNPTNWYRHLGLVLLGMRAAVKEDLGCSSAEMTLGTQLRLPGQFFVEEEGPSQTEYRKQLSELMATLRPTPPRDCTNQRAYVDKKLKLCTQGLQEGGSGGTSYSGPGSRSPEEFRLPR